MKEGWKYKRLGEVCDILDGKRKPITKNKREAGKIPYYGATGVLDFVKDYIFDEKLVLLGEDGAKWGAGEPSAYIINGKSWVNNHAHTLRPHRQTIIDEYLVYFLNFSNLLDYITGVTVPKLNQEKMRSIPIPVPPLSEQERIVAYLDKQFERIDMLKNNAEHQLQAAKDLFQAALKELLTPKEGWEENKLGELVTKLVDGSHNPPKGVEKNPYKMFSSRNVNFDGLQNLSDVRYLSKEDFITEDKRTRAKTDDVLLTIVGTIGRSYVLKEDDLPLTLQRSVAIITPKSFISSRYLMYYFKGIDKVLNDNAHGAAQKGIYLNQLKSVFILYPTFPEQQNIVSRLDALSERVKQLQSNYEQTITLCNDLKQALLKSIFE